MWSANNGYFLASLEFVVKTPTASSHIFISDRSKQGTRLLCRHLQGLILKPRFSPQESTPVRRSVFKIYNVTHCAAFSRKKIENPKDASSN